VGLALLLALACGPPDTIATICPETSGVRQSYNEAGAVLLGKVIRSDRFASRYVIRTERVFKGKVPNEFVVLSMDSADLQLVQGETYLIYARYIDSKGRASIDVCSRTAPKRLAAADIEKLDKLISEDRKAKP